MNKKKLNKEEMQVLTERMDTGTNEFNEFQAILLNKTKDRTDEQKRRVELMALKFRMEDYVLFRIKMNSHNCPE